MYRLCSASCFGKLQFHQDRLSRDRTWMQIQPGMPKQEVYAKLGQPIRETDREAEWRRPEDNGWRVVVISFDENGRTALVRGHHEQK